MKIKGMACVGTVELVRNVAAFFVQYIRKNDPGSFIDKQASFSRTHSSRCTGNQGYFPIQSVWHNDLQQEAYFG